MEQNLRIVNSQDVSKICHLEFVDPWREKIFCFEYGKPIEEKDKFALLWGEAQKKIAYSYPRVTYSDPKVNYSDPKVTHSDPTHLPLPPPTSPGHCLTIS